MPDELVGWLPSCLPIGLLVARRARPDVIYASGPPFSVVLAGALLARATRTALVSDFRDTWTLDPADPFGTLEGSFHVPRQSKRRSALRSLEAWCVARSARVLFTSHATLALYESEYPLEGRALVIRNGVDPDDFGPAPAPAATPTLAHVGSLHEFQWPQLDAFLKGVAQARANGGLRPCHTRFVGAIGQRLASRIDATVEALGLRSAVFRIGLVSQQEAIREMQAADGLLLFAGENPYIRLSKLAECAASGRPLLTFAAPGSETAREAVDVGARVISDISPVAVADALTDVLRTGLATRGQRPPFPFNDPHPLNRWTEARELARVLDEISPKGDE